MHHENTMSRAEQYKLGYATYSDLYDEYATFDEIRAEYESEYGDEYYE